MKLVIGGAYQGKTAAAMELYQLRDEDILDGASCSPEEIYKAKAVRNFHMLIRRLLKEKGSASDLAQSIIAENPGICIITNEVGYGIVPIDVFEREWREACGRVCCILAEYADEMVRVTAGCCMYLKGKES